ncbi:outer membrane protein assembly factor BamC [Aeromonas enteropelogenes]|uniref:outer membrane protein assembly factor BamC n=1 Tax=Aeromonas TaxID=642 RepID=UPI00191CE63A|nr:MULTISPECIES: outer membrane protein assembly factor BamC [Aeromonas]MBL0458898.1 outer membrane protein assembly factor BamC [Aeromonas enteropelogenes]QXC34251.1 outer membrane protein assembly factor BamC [Aeromonas sp. FDAARGOS 1407]
MFKSNGKGNRARLVLSVATVAVLAGCSTPQDRKMANRGFEYEDARLEGRAFLIPAGLSAPTFNSQFDIPPLPESSREGALGAKVDVRPPAQLLTVVPGSQVVPNASEPTIAYYALSSGQSVERDTWSFLMNFLAKYKVSTEKLDQQAGVLQTGWFDNTVALDGWAEDDEDFKIRQRYQFTVRNDEQRHAVNMSVRVLDHEETIDGETSNRMSEAEAQRYAARVLNQFSLYYDSQLKAREQHKASDGMGLELGLDNNELAAWVANGSFEQVWRRLNQVLPKYGFIIKDTQQSLGWIDVEYEEPGAEFWQAKGSEPFKLDEEKYRFQLGEMAGGKTSITLFDKDKKPVSSGVISQMYISLSEAFAKGLADQAANAE